MQAVEARRAAIPTRYRFWGELFEIAQDLNPAIEPSSGRNAEYRQ